MSENRTEVFLGGLVLAVALGFLVYASQSTGLVSPRGGYEIVASFNSAEGVNPGTDVRMAGVKIGTVTALDLNPETFMADMRFSVHRDIALPEDSAIIIASEGLLGGSFVEIIPGGSPVDLEPGGRIFDTQSSISLVTLLLRFVTGGGGE